MYTYMYMYKGMHMYMYTYMAASSALRAYNGPLAPGDTCNIWNVIMLSMLNYNGVLRVLNQLVYLCPPY